MIATSLIQSTRAAPPRAVIDIGSNSVRLVVFHGPARLPQIVLNEKVPASLGRTLAIDGMLPPEATALALRALGRFAVLLRKMNIARPRVVATAATRDASNGADFLDQVRALGLSPELLNGEQEAAASARGVLSAFPDADGIVGDLGGGSLELVEVAKGAVGRGDSVPWGSLRLPRLRQDGDAAFDREIGRTLKARGWLGAAEGRTFYLVGGSWRALAVFDMHTSDYPLDEPHGYEFRPEQVTALAERIQRIPAKRLREISGISGLRATSLADATALLAVLGRRLAPKRMIVSAYGLREGLLYGDMDEATRALDPLIVAAHDHGIRAGADPALGLALGAWLDPLFEEDTPRDARLRLAAALLAVGGGALDRALAVRRARETMLNRPWVGIDARGRAMIATALAARFGERQPASALAALCSPADLARAVRWGAAMRAGVRLSASLADVLERSELAAADGRLVLRLPQDLAALYDDGIEQQHRSLGELLGLAPVLEVGEGSAASRWPSLLTRRG